MNKEKKAVDIFPFIILTHKSVNKQYELPFKFNTSIGVIQNPGIFYPSEQDENGTPPIYSTIESPEEIAQLIHEMHEIHFRHKAEIEREVNTVIEMADPKVSIFEEVAEATKPSKQKFYCCNCDTELTAMMHCTNPSCPGVE